jgi:phosphatidylglycerophosphate synthase
VKELVTLPVWVLCIAAFFTAASAAQYLLDGVRQLEREK